MEAEQIASMLGPALPRPDTLDLDVEERVNFDAFSRLKISYTVPAGRASAYICVPNKDGQFPLVVCHHQHAGDFALGKSETVGLVGDPDMAFGSELAAPGYVTISSDAIGFEDRNWADGANTTWFELSVRLVAGRTLLADCL